MAQVYVRLYAELGDFLRNGAGHTELVVGLERRTSVKDLIESLGVPHTEIDLLLIDGESVGFETIVESGARISAYPRFRSLDVSELTRVRPDTPAALCFVLDTHLGRLAAYLRLLGFDTLYRNDYADETLARISSEEGRILLTRDRGLLKRSVVKYGYHVWETHPERQLVEVLRRFELSGAAAPFHRCIECNGEIESVAKAEIADRLPPKTRQFYDEFRRCRSCDRVFWKGSHFERMERLVRQALADSGG
ncbi:MAG: Mut7-C ubiquitin/RNAse domain-containing protein [Chloroflexi bacterium]|nr:Mut7-C ubiquitin/RNAse domain-containing protein [Chloroflexota bacterium]